MKIRHSRKPTPWPWRRFRKLYLPPLSSSHPLCTYSPSLPPSLSLSLLPSLHPLIPHIHTLFSHPLSLASPHVHLLCLISQVPGCVFGKLDGVIKQVLVFWELSSSVEQGWVGGGISGLVLGNHCVNQTKILKPYKFSDIWSPTQ